MANLLWTLVHIKFYYNYFRVLNREPKSIQ